MNHAHDRKISGFFIYKYLVITEAVCCDIFESFCNGGKAKIMRRVVCKLVSAGLYCTCASSDIVPLRVGQPGEWDAVFLPTFCLGEP